MMKEAKLVVFGEMHKISLLMAGVCACVALTCVAESDATVQGMNAPNGALAVDSGTTVLTNGFDATLPEALATSAVLWFSADKNVSTDENGGVTESLAAAQCYWNVLSASTPHASIWKADVSTWAICILRLSWHPPRTGI